MSVQVIEKKVQVEGRDLLVRLLRMGDQEGLLTTQVAHVLGIELSSVRGLVSRHDLNTVAISSETRKDLQSVGILQVQAGRTPRFLSKDAIKELVRIVNTPQAKAIYNPEIRQRNFDKAIQAAKSFSF